MAECPAIGKCPFFSGRMTCMPVAASRFKAQYCLGDHRPCARWTVRVACGAAAVPNDLLPNQLDRAQSIVGTHRRTP